MGNCAYCGKPAGLFRKKHEECELKSITAWENMMELVYNAMVGEQDHEQVEIKLRQLAKDNYLPESKVKESIVCSWEKTVNSCIAKDGVGNVTEKALMESLTRFRLTPRDVDKGGLYTKLIKSAVTKEILAGNSSDWINPDNSSRTAIINGWSDAAVHFLDDGILTEEEEQKLLQFQNKYSLTQSELDRSGVYSKLIKAAVIRDVLNGEFPTRVKIEGNMPFNFQKGERIVCFFKDVQYYEDKIRRQYVGGSQGVSLRIAKGVYYRVGAFKGEAVETTQRVLIDTGLLAITDKNIYFAGGNKSLRIRHDKIVSHMPFSDGVGIHKEGVTAKPQIFITGDGWFTYNLLSNISNLE